MAELHLSGARAIDLAALDALRRHAGPSTEPHLVAAIFRDARFRTAIIDAVDDDWGPVRVRTVFVHQRPRSASPAGEGRRTAANWEMLWSSIASAYGLARRARKRCSFKPSAGTVNSGIG
jgi:hypothetical protein